MLQIGWDQAEFCMADFASRMCNGFPLRERSGFRTSLYLVYRFQCGYYNYLKCGWQLRVLIPFNQFAELSHYYETRPDIPAPPHIVDIQHSPQTLAMVSAKSGLRASVHQHHLCRIETTGTHKKHNAYQHTQAHCMFKAYCTLHPYALRYGNADIQSWLRHNRIDTVHVSVDETSAEETSTDRLKKMVKSCKRYAEAKIKSMDIDMDACSSYPEAKLHALCQKYSLSATVARLGQTHFDHHTSYVIPGWSAISDRQLPAGGMCVMITTFNLILNYSRAAKWFDGNVTLALDHTYKVTSMRAHASLPRHTCSRPA